MTIKSIPHSISDITQSNPDRIAVTYRDISKTPFTDHTLTYGELWRLACSFASALEPIEPGSHIMLVMPLGLRLLAAHLAVQLQAGMCSIFTHPSEKISSDVYIRKLNHVISVVEPDVVITSNVFASNLEETLSTNSCRIIMAEEISNYSEFTPNNWEKLQSDKIAVIQYSSGSTGLQKAVALTHNMVIEQCESYSRFINLDSENDHICSWLPLYHDMGLFTTWLIPIIGGVPISMIDPFQWVKNPFSFLQLINDFQGTLCWLPNFAFNFLAMRINSEELSQIDLSTMRGFINCSEPVGAKAMKNFYDTFKNVGVEKSKLWTCYAMAEIAFTVTGSGGPNEDRRSIYVKPSSYASGLIELSDNKRGIKLISCGVPIDGCQIKIVDNSRNLVDEGIIGEISIKSNYMLTEYINDPDATKDRIDSDGWYYSGDLGFIMDGRLFVTGRIKDLLIVGGENYYPQDIERITDGFDDAIPGRSVALGIDDDKSGTQKIILIVESYLSDSKRKNELATKIRTAVFEELYCTISDVVIVPHLWLLKTSSGKIARRPNINKYYENLKRPRISFKIEKLREKMLLVFWSFTISLIIFLYLLFFVLSVNDSWNIYVGF